MEAIDDHRAQTIIANAFDYLACCDEVFDVIVCDLSDPVPIWTRIQAVLQGSL